MNPEATNNDLGHRTEAPIIETTGISKIYKISDEMVTPVSDVSLQISYGDFAVVFGPSGAGKSTLLNILMGLEDPDVGEVFIKGSSLYRFNEEARTTIRRQRIGYIPQAHYWIDYMSILDNVALPLLLQGQSKSKARSAATQVLGRVDLMDRVKHRPSELSSGQQQKAAIARALVKKPWIIFADEPTSHLDTESVKEVTDLFLDINKSHGITLVMVTHDLNFLKLSKKWFFMSDGRLHDIKDHDNPFQDIKEVVAYLTDHPDQENAQGLTS